MCSLWSHHSCGTGSHVEHRVKVSGEASSTAAWPQPVGSILGWQQCVAAWSEIDHPRVLWLGVREAMGLPYHPRWRWEQCAGSGWCWGLARRDTPLVSMWWTLLLAWPAPEISARDTETQNDAPWVPGGHLWQWGRPWPSVSHHPQWGLPLGWARWDTGQKNDGITHQEIWTFVTSLHSLWRICYAQHLGFTCPPCHGERAALGYAISRQCI